MTMQKQVEQAVRVLREVERAGKLEDFDLDATTVALVEAALAAAPALAVDVERYEI
jgi:uncharacterized protein with von Willebrand factor type A (vWA) domain